MTEQIENLNQTLSWSAPVRRGSKLVRIAQPNPAFWSLWRADKEAVKAAGFSCRPAGSGWEVVSYNVSDAEVASDMVNSAPALPPASPEAIKMAARFVPGFVPPALDTSRAWSDEQIAIFNHFRDDRRNLVVEARAGTGKTTTIKVAFSQAPEETILYAVFGKRNQREAQDSITDGRVEIKTLHAVGYKLIRMVWANARVDDDVEYDRIKAVIGAQAADSVRGQLFKLVGFAKNLFIAPSIDDLVDLAQMRSIECPEFPEWPVERLAEAALKVLELSKIRDPQGRICFNDMVWLPVACNWVRPLFDLVVVDEAQDMNMPQLVMALGLVRQGGRVIVVGDSRQAIYAFRGAAANGMRMMQEKLNALVLPLTVTYRCPKAVVKIAAEFVPDYRAHESAPNGIVASIGDVAMLKVVQIGDAILSRANAPLAPICLKLLRQGIPARIEGRDIGKTLAGIASKLNARSVPNFISRVEGWAAKQTNRFQGTKNGEAKCALIQDQAATLIAIAEDATSVQEVLSRLNNLFVNSDEKGVKPAVVLSSVHKAKGLEWNRVFLISHTFKTNEKEGEEANIYYVAVTRAKAELYGVFEEKPNDN
jgi:superfamily I DNA/RNA helicase